MPSSYSALKFELIATGEQSGTWGNTTNANIGTAIEEAIVGQATANFSSDADLTLTLANTTATQVARNFSLYVTSTGSLTATRNLIVPAIEKPYRVANATTGGQSIVVKNSSGTGVTVPNGKSVLVYNDGTNVLQMSDYTPLATIGTLTLSNALGVASGGTGAATLTGIVKGNGTSAMTAVTAPTGTIVGTTDTQTLTNKRVTARVAAASNSFTPNADSYDQYNVTGSADIIVAVPSGTPTDGQKLIFRIKDNGTSRPITFASTSGGFRLVGAIIPASTTVNKVLYVGCIYNSSASYWDVVAATQEA